MRLEMFVDSVSLTSDFKISIKLYYYFCILSRVYNHIVYALCFVVCSIIIIIYMFIFQVCILALSITTHAYHSFFFFFSNNKSIARIFFLQLFLNLYPCVMCIKMLLSTIKLYCTKIV